MPENPTVDDLVTRWYVAQEQGQAPSAEELCAGQPELLEEVQRRLRDVARLQSFLQLSQLAPSASDQAGITTQPEARSASPAIGVGKAPSLPGYEILSELGRGGMGVVYQARQVKLKRLVALKMVLAGGHAGTAELARFRTEALSVARLQHPNIVQIYEVADHEGLPYFSMEFVAGTSLAKKLEQGPLPPRQAAQLTELLARAMQHCHQRGVVHRDLKPANILLSEEGTPKITDFGLARKLDEVGQTQTGAVMGTPSYMAPEQAQGKTTQLGPLVDVYALGAVLYELLTGQPPFRGKTVMDTLQQVICDEPIPPSQRQAGTPRDLETICLKGLAKEPARRYASALALAQDLERYLAGEPILARRAGVLGRLWRRVRRRPVATLSVPLLLLALVAGVVGFQQLRGSRRGTELARQFNKDLPESQWSNDRAVQLERLLEEWSRLDPGEAAAARGRLHDHFARLFREALKQPRLEPGDVTRLEAELQWLTPRDGERASALGQELRTRVRAWQPRFDLQAPFNDNARVFAAGQVRQQGEVLFPARASAPANVFVPTQVSSRGRVQLEATFDPAWQDSSRLALRLDCPPAQGRQGYDFRLSVAEPVAGAPEPRKPVAKAGPKSFRRAGGSARMEILRNGVVLRRQALVVAKGPLNLVARREGDRLEFQVNSGTALVFFDTVPLRGGPDDVLGLDWPAGVGLKQLRATAQTLPEKPSPLERGDQLFDEGRFAGALPLYQEQALAAPASEAGREARCKAALCLVQLNRLDEAAKLFEPLAGEAEGRWPLLAACQLWLLRLQQDRLGETGALFTSIRARFRREDLAAYVPETVKQRLLSSVAPRRVDVLMPSARLLPPLEQAVELADLLGDENDRCMTRYHLCQGYAFAGDEARALAVARQAMPLVLQSVRVAPSGIDAPYWISRRFAWLMRGQGRAREGLAELDRFHGEFADLLRHLYPDDPKARQRHAAPLLLERAPLLLALNEAAQAEKEVDAFLALTPDPVTNYNYYSLAWLMKGFFHDRRGQAGQALRCWKEGLYSSYLKKFSGVGRPDAALPPFSEGLMRHGIMASLGDDLSDRDAEALRDQWLAALAENPLAAQVGAMLRPSPAVFRGMWRTPRGRARARQMAFLELPLAEYYRTPALALVVETVRQDAFAGQTTAEQDELLWQTTTAALAQFNRGKLSGLQLSQLALTWKGSTSFLGWAGVAPKLDPALRGPVAYLFGQRYLRRKNRADALMFFRTALKDAAADSPLRRLAQQEITRLDSK